MNKYWLSCQQFTVGFETENDIITKTAPIIDKFKGQRFTNLINWVYKLDKEYTLLKFDEEKKQYV